MSKKSKKPISRPVIEFVEQRAGGQCEYCLKFKLFSRTEFHIDHIVAEQHDGGSEPENLAYACRFCNGFKGTNLVTTLPGRDEYVPLFHPRKDKWRSHFSLDESGLIVGKTSKGKATLKLLEFNTVENIITRSRLISAGLLTSIS